MSTHLHIFFFPKKSRATVRQTIPIYLRVTVQGKRMEVTTNRFVLPNQWSLQANKVKGKSQEAEAIIPIWTTSGNRFMNTNRRYCWIIRRLPSKLYEKNGLGLAKGNIP